MLSDEMDIPSLDELAKALGDAEEDLLDPENSEALECILAANVPGSFPSMYSPPVSSAGMAPFPSLPQKPLPGIKNFNGSSNSQPHDFEKNESAEKAGQPYDFDRGRGPDTLVLSEKDIGQQGNWVKKKEWLKQARELQDEILKSCEDIQAHRKNFYREKREKADNLLDDFYREVGAQRGNVTASVQTIGEKVNTSIEALKEMKAKFNSNGDGSMDFALYELEGKIASYKDDIEQIKFDVESIHDMDSSVAERIDAIDGYIDSALEDRSKGQEVVTLMFSLVDHEKARIKYYELKGFYERVKAIKNYIKETAATDFTTLVGQIESHTNKIKTQVSAIQNDVEEIKKRLDESQKVMQVKRAAGISGKDSSGSRGSASGFFRSLIPF